MSCGGGEEAVDKRDLALTFERLLFTGQVGQYAQQNSHSNIIAFRH
jgi:hypothetical protein